MSGTQKTAIWGMSGNMEPAVFIARLTGPLLVVIGVGVLLNEANYAAMITEARTAPP